MTTTTTDVQNTNARIGQTTFKRMIAPSAAKIAEDILDFLYDPLTDPDIIDETDWAELDRMAADFEHIDRVELNEGKLRAKHSTTPAKIKARKWYNNPANKKRVLQKKKQREKSQKYKTDKKIMAKSQRTPTGRKKKEYNVKKKNEMVLVEKQIEAGAKLAAARLMAPKLYVVKKLFSINDEIEASRGERLEYLGSDTWRLIKRNNTSFKFVVNRGVLAPYIKEGTHLTLEDVL